MPDPILATLARSGKSDPSPEPTFKGSQFEYADQLQPAFPSLDRDTVKDNGYGVNLSAALVSPEHYNEELSYAQGPASSFFNGLGRATNTFAMELLKIPGYVGGLAPGVSLFDNAYLKGIESLKKHINEEYIPVHIGKDVAEGGLGDKIASMEWWGTTGADGIGFLTSMMVPGQVLKLLGVGSKLATGTASMANKTINSKLFQSVNKISGGRFATTYDDVLNLAKSGKSPLLVTKDAQKLYYENLLVQARTAGNTARVAELEATIGKLGNIKGLVATEELARGLGGFSAAALNTFAEASAEAGNTFTNVYETLKADNPFMAEEDLRAEAGKRASSVFNQNMALLFTSNILDEAWFWKSFSRQSASSPLVQRAYRELQDSTFDVSKVAGKATKRQMFGTALKGALKGIAKEGIFEEGTQYEIQNEAENLETDFTNPENFIFATIKNIAGNLSNIIGAPVEKQEAMFLGAVLGGGMTTAGEVSSRKNEETALYGGQYNAGFMSRLRGLKPQSTEGIVQQLGKAYDEVNSFTADFVSAKEKGWVAGDGTLTEAGAKAMANDNIAVKVAKQLTINQALKNGDTKIASLHDDHVWSNYFYGMLQHEGGSQVVDSVIDDIIMPKFIEQYEQINKLQPSEEIIKERKAHLKSLADDLNVGVTVINETSKFNFLKPTKEQTELFNQFTDQELRTRTGAYMYNRLLDRKKQFTEELLDKYELLTAYPVGTADRLDKFFQERFDKTEEKKKESFTPKEHVALSYKNEEGKSVPYTGVTLTDKKARNAEIDQENAEAKLKVDVLNEEIEAHNKEAARLLKQWNKLTDDGYAGEMFNLGDENSTLVARINNKEFYQKFVLDTLGGRENVEFSATLNKAFEEYRKDYLDSFDNDKLKKKWDKFLLNIQEEDALKKKAKDFFDNYVQYAINQGYRSNKRKTMGDSVRITDPMVFSNGTENVIVTISTGQTLEGTVINGKHKGKKFNLELVTDMFRDGMELLPAAEAIEIKRLHDAAVKRDTTLTHLNQALKLLEAENIGVKTTLEQYQKAEVAVKKNLKELLDSLNKKNYVPHSRSKIKASLEALIKDQTQRIEHFQEVIDNAKNTLELNETLTAYLKEYVDLLNQPEYVNFTKELDFKKELVGMRNQLRHFTANIPIFNEDGTINETFSETLVSEEAKEFLKKLNEKTETEKNIVNRLQEFNYHRAELTSFIEELEEAKESLIQTIRDLEAASNQLSTIADDEMRRAILKKILEAKFPSDIVETLVDTVHDQTVKGSITPNQLYGYLNLQFGEELINKYKVKNNIPAGTNPTTIKNEIIDLLTQYINTRNQSLTEEEQQLADAYGKLISVVDAITTAEEKLKGLGVYQKNVLINKFYGQYSAFVESSTDVFENAVTPLYDLNDYNETEDFPEYYKKKDVLANTMNEKKYDEAKSGNFVTDLLTAASYQGSEIGIPVSTSEAQERYAKFMIQNMFDENGDIKHNVMLISYEQLKKLALENSDYNDILSDINDPTNDPNNRVTDQTIFSIIVDKNENFVKEGDKHVYNVLYDTLQYDSGQWKIVVGGKAEEITNAVRQAQSANISITTLSEGEIRVSITNIKKDFVGPDLLNDIEHEIDDDGKITIDFELVEEFNEFMLNIAEKQYQDYRSKIINGDAGIIAYVTRVSPGFPTLVKDIVNNKPNADSVFKRLPELTWVNRNEKSNVKKLSNGARIRVSRNGEVPLLNTTTTVSYPKGFGVLVLQNGRHLPLLPSTLSDDDANVVLAMLIKYGGKVKENPTIKVGSSEYAVFPSKETRDKKEPSLIEALMPYGIYFKDDVLDMTRESFHVSYFNNRPRLTIVSKYNFGTGSIGENFEKVDIYIDDLKKDDTLQAEVYGFLKTRRYAINDASVNKDSAFFAQPVLNENNEVGIDSRGSYQQFLLDGENPRMQTHIIPHELSKPQWTGRYMVFQFEAPEAKKTIPAIDKASEKIGAKVSEEAFEAGIEIGISFNPADNVSKEVAVPEQTNSSDDSWLDELIPSLKQEDETTNEEEC